MDSLAKGRRVVIGMVGLPARGKSYIARKIARYLNWQQIKCEVFNIGQYRRQLYGTKECTAEFFDPDNQEGMKAREQCAQLCLEDMIEFLTTGGGKVAIYDGTNTTAERRKMVRETIVKSIPKCNVIWIESICTDEKIVENNIKSAKLSNPDYKGVDPEQAIKDFLERINQYKKKYQELDESVDGEDCSFLKLYNVGKRVVVNNINGYLASKVVSYLMNLQVNPHPIYLVKAGETQYMLENRMGGDSDLTTKGKKYAQALNEFFQKEKQEGKITSGAKIFTSTLKRTANTAAALDLGCEIYNLRILDELSYGVFDGVTLKDLEEKFSREFSDRKADKLRYRFQRGESYLDLIQRIEPVIFEIEKSKDAAIVVADTTVIRCLYAYFSKHEIQEVPFLNIPHNTVIKLMPEAYFCYENRYEINVESGDIKEQQNPTPLVQVKPMKRTISNIFYKGME